MKKFEFKDIKVGKYYLVDMKKEIKHTSLGKIIGKVIYKNREFRQFIIDNSYQNILIEFIEENHHFHNGLGLSNHNGEKNHCYYIATRGIIREIPKIEVFGEIL